MYYMILWDVLNPSPPQVLHLYHKSTCTEKGKCYPLSNSKHIT